MDKFTKVRHRMFPATRRNYVVLVVLRRPEVVNRQVLGAAKVVAQQEML